MIYQKNTRRDWGRSVSVVLAVCLAWGGGIGAASGQEIVQGKLALHWGDPRPVTATKAPGASRLRAFLLADDGRRIRLDVAAARQAAGNLDTLANRRIAVAFASSRLRVSDAKAERVPEVIVPADSAVSSNGAITASAPVMAAAIAGPTRWVTLMCKFSDIATEQKNQAFFQGQYGNGVGQLGHYWNEVSYGQVSLTGSTAHGWYVLPQPRSAYVSRVNGNDDADLDLLFQDCVSMADAQVDFTGVQGINMMFNGELDGFAWGGSSCATFDGSRRCIRVTWNPPWSFKNLAPLAHEMGHGYGLPHSDNSDGDDDVYDNPWDVMSDAWHNAVTDATYGTRPKHISMIQRDRLGWVGAARKLVIPAGMPGVWNVELQYASLRSAAGKQLIVLSMPAQADPTRTVQYTLEARRRGGDYETALAGDAVIIHRVRAGMAYSEDASAPPATVSNNEGSMFKVGETWRTADGVYSVSVNGTTAEGFLLTISATGQLTGGNQPALRRTAVSPQAAPASNANAITAPSPSSFRRSPATRRIPRKDLRSLL